MDDRQARMALGCVIEPGFGHLDGLFDEYTPAELWRSLKSGAVESRWSRRARDLDLSRIEAHATTHGLRFVVPGDDEWPMGMSDLDTCQDVQSMGGQPFGLWLKGSMDLRHALAACVAIVGSRAATAYGEAVAGDVAAELGDAGWTPVSGGAYGIDAAAHRGGLASRAGTVAVLAGGLDEPYPAGHRTLFERIADHGVLVSEVPPGHHPTRVRFLARNRLIAAMTPGVILVEAALRSGARNTVTWASSMQRRVMAVPGPIHHATSVTPHRLIRDAEAVLVTGAAEVMEVLSPAGQGLSPARSASKRPLDELDPAQLTVYEALPAKGRVSAGEISLLTGVAVGACHATLTQLIDAGLVSEVVPGQYRLPQRSATHA